MQDRRLFFRTILKVLVSLGVLFLLIVFFNSLFNARQTKINEVGDELAVALDISELQLGQIKKTRWKGKEVAVLYRQNMQSEIRQSNPEENLHPSLQTYTRSRKPEYFVYINMGDSGNCPLFYSQGIFKDICTANKFDENGRGIRADQGRFSIQIPPHHFIGDVVVFSSWGD